MGRVRDDEMAVFSGEGLVRQHDQLAAPWAVAARNHGRMALASAMVVELGWARSTNGDRKSGDSVSRSTFAVDPC